MGVRKSSSRDCEQLKPGQLLMWGSAAWAQTQLTPGVSTLAAPRQILFAHRNEEQRVNVSYALRLLGVVAGWAGLLTSLLLLNREPLFGVLGVLGAMALLLGSMAKLCEDKGNTQISMRREDR
jgi:CHASE2 domain-containing sensor protein